MMGACRRRRARRTRNGSGSEGEQTLESAVKGKAVVVEKRFGDCVYGCRGAYLINEAFSLGRSGLYLSTFLCL